MQGASSLQPLLVPNRSGMLGPTSRLLPNQNEFEVTYTRFFNFFGEDTKWWNFGDW